MRQFGYCSAVSKTGIWYFDQSPLVQLKPHAFLVGEVHELLKGEERRLGCHGLILPHGQQVDALGAAAEDVEIVAGAVEGGLVKVGPAGIGLDRETAPES